MQELDGRVAPPSQGRSAARDPMNAIFRAVLNVEHDIPSLKQRQ